ncbi:DUF499 domain-containing protein [Luedemannella flava]
MRRRLFVTPDAEALAGIGATARAFIEFYRKHPDDFPREARDNDYETRIRHTYPVHPELFDRLYEDWSSLERFQRTRGVLRLMNTVIHALWVGEDTAPLIMPGSIPLASATVNSELTQYLQDSWKAIIDADVDGPNSEPVKIDNARPVFGQRSLTRRLARTVFFGAAPTIGTAHKGIEAQRLFLGVAVPGDVPGNFHASLTQLADKTTYFYTGAGKYWYDLQANISRRAKDQAERLHPEDVWAEIVERLKGQAKTRGSFAGVHVCPDDTADIPDTDEARLIILHPKATYQRKDQSNTAMTFAHTATEHRGTANRTYRNMVVYLAADADRMAELDTAVREYLGWSDVIDKQDELDLTQNQKNQAAEKRRQADQTVGSRLLGTYHWALVPEQPKPDQPFTIRAVKAEGRRQRSPTGSASGSATTVRSPPNKLPPPSATPSTMWSRPCGPTDMSRSATCGRCTRPTPTCRACATGSSSTPASPPPFSYGTPTGSPSPTATTKRPTATAGCCSPTTTSAQPSPTPPSSYSLTSPNGSTTRKSSVRCRSTARRSHLRVTRPDQRPIQRATRTHQ